MNVVEAVVEEQYGQLLVSKAWKKRQNIKNRTISYQLTCLLDNYLNKLPNAQRRMVIFNPSDCEILVTRLLIDDDGVSNRQTQSTIG
jgi:hypothetical protein